MSGSRRVWPLGRARRRVSIGIVLGLLGVVAFAVAGWLALGGTTATPAVAVVNRGTLAAPGRADAPTGHTSAAHAGARVTRLGANARLVFARLRVQARIVAVSAPHSVMQIPRDPQVLGWWRDGAAPGSGRGHVVVVGHINYDGQAGALARLPDVRPGDAVALSDGKLNRYRVIAVRTYPKTSGIPADVFSSDGPEQLVLITCGGPFDAHTGNYEDNIVAYAARA